MSDRDRHSRNKFGWLAWVVFGLSLTTTPLLAQNTYVRTNLVSDIAGVANFRDKNLVNSWGITASTTSPFWVADNGTGVATLYNGQGQGFPVVSPLVVTIPTPPNAKAGAVAAPTGVVFNGSSVFVISAGGISEPAKFIFDTEDGTISGWGPAPLDETRAILVVNNSGPGMSADRTRLGAVYKGLAISNNGTANFIYATNFRDAVVEMYDGKFQLVKKFTDPDVPAGFAPFGIRNINGQLFVTFALQNAQKHDDVAGPGNGFVDIFDLNGKFQKRFASRGALKSPWGLAQAPANFGSFSNAILVGNFGDGTINAFDPSTGNHLGGLQDVFGNALTINGLWGLSFGNDHNAGPSTTLFFTAGIGDEAHGLFGAITLK